MDGIADLEMRCEQPGLWWIEGVQVRRVRRGRWLIVWEPGVRSEQFPSFYEAKKAIVDHINWSD